MSPVRSLICALFAVLLAGCDQDALPVSFDRRKPATDSRELEEKREREMEQGRLLAERQSLRLRFVAAEAVVSNELEAVGTELKGLADDRATLSARIGELSRTDPKGRTNVQFLALLKILEDATVNDLARRYLGRDFHLSRLELEVAVDKVSAALRQQEAELKASRDSRDAQIASAREESRLAREEARKAGENMKRAIVNLETRRTKLNQKLQIVSTAERERFEQELRDIDSQLRSLKQSYDGMRANRDVAYERSRAGREEDRSIDRASRRTAAEEDRIRRRFKDLKDVSEVLSQCERTTVRELERAMSERQEKLERSKREKIRIRTLLAAMESGVDDLGFGALKKSSAELEKLMKRLSSAD